MWTGAVFRPFEVAPSPGMTSYLNTMEANDLAASEFTLSGWLNADMFVTAIRAAAGDTGEFDRASIVEALNTLPEYTGGGILPTFVWAKEHDGDSVNCTAFMKVDGAAKTYVSVAPEGTPWTCFDVADPDPLVFTYETFGEEDTGLSTTGVSGTETVDTKPKEQPVDPAAASEQAIAAVNGFLTAPDNDAKLAFVANGESVRSFQEQGAPSAATVTPFEPTVVFDSATLGSVVYDVSLDGGQTGLGIKLTTAVVEVDGKWFVHPISVCDFLAANPSNPPQLGKDCIDSSPSPTPQASRRRTGRPSARCGVGHIPVSCG